MIHIERTPRPVKLTDEVVRQKTYLFKNDNNVVVWREKYIIDALMNMSHNKCAYCECMLGEESKYMEVEHFHDKSSYPDEVVCWHNLLPSCKTCNVNKSTHDTYKVPIINPTVDYPQSHMMLKGGIRFRGMDDLGKETIAILDLNNQDRHCTNRYKIGQAVVSELEKLEAGAEEYVSGGRKQTSQGLGRLRNSVVNLMCKGTPDKEYASIVATVLLNDELYLSLKNNLQKLGCWTDEMERFESVLESERYQS